MRMFERMLCALLVLVLASFACAETLVLPQGLLQIGERAFYRDTSLDEVILPEGIRSIGKQAFAWSSIKKINLPDSLDYIAPDVFSGVNVQELTINPGSYAHEWALSCGMIKHELDIGTYDISVAIGMTAKGIFTAPFTGVFSFFSTGSTDTCGYMYDTEGRMILSNDDGGDDSNFLMTRLLTQGETVVIGVRYFNSANDGHVLLTIEGERNSNRLGLGDNSIELGDNETARCEFTAPYAGLFCFETAGLGNTEICLSEDGNYTGSVICALKAGEEAGLYVKHIPSATGSADIHISAMTKTETATVYRALLIGQVNFAGDICRRNASDVNRIRNMLRTVNGGAYSVKTALDLTPAGVEAAIASAFAGADENDVSFFFYASHGEYTEGEHYGSLRTFDGGYISPGELAMWLSRVPGKVIVIVGTCGSGALIEDRAKSAGGGSYDDISRLLIEAFASYDRGVSVYTENSGELRQGKFYVMTASSGGESSWGVENGDQNTSFNYFAKWFAESAGETGPVLTADTDNDGCLTLAESYAYVAEQAASRFFLNGKQQHPMVYPSNSSFVLFTK